MLVLSKLIPSLKKHSSWGMQGHAAHAFPKGRSRQQIHLPASFPIHSCLVSVASHLKVLGNKLHTIHHYAVLISLLSCRLINREGMLFKFCDFFSLLDIDLLAIALWFSLLTMIEFILLTCTHDFSSWVLLITLNTWKTNRRRWSLCTVKYTSHI